MTLGDSGTLALLANDGRVHLCDIRHPIPRVEGDELEELVISMLSHLPESITRERIAEQFSTHPRLDKVLEALEQSAVLKSPLGIEEVGQLYALTRAESPDPNDQAMLSGVQVSLSSAFDSVTTSSDYCPSSVDGADSLPPHRPQVSRADEHSA